MFATINSVAGLAVCCAILLAAILRGGGTEQTAAGAVAFGWASTLVLYAYVTTYARWILVIDVALLVVFAVIVWRARKDWPLLALAFQGVVAALDAWYLLDRTIPMTIYKVAQSASSFGVLACIAFGVWQASQQRRAATR